MNRIQLISVICLMPLLLVIGCDWDSDGDTGKKELSAACQQVLDIEADNQSLKKIIAALTRSNT